VEWVGLRNYERILTDEDVWLNMQATAHFLFWCLFFQILIGFTLAWLINKKFRGNDLWTTLIVLPMMLSPAVVGNFWKFLLSAADRALQLRGRVRHGTPASSFQDDRRRSISRPWSIVIVDTWMWTPS
jgi:multiple sugar transport system permease protein